MKIFQSLSCFCRELNCFDITSQSKRSFCGRRKLLIGSSLCTKGLNFARCVQKTHKGSFREQNIVRNGSVDHQQIGKNFWKDSFFSHSSVLLFNCLSSAPKTFSLTKATFYRNFQLASLSFVRKGMFVEVFLSGLFTRYKEGLSIIVLL